MRENAKNFSTSGTIGWWWWLDNKTISQQTFVECIVVFKLSYEFIIRGHTQTHLHILAKYLEKCLNTNTNTLKIWNTNIYTEDVFQIQMQILLKCI